jgi:hypothetical protein
LLTCFGALTQLGNALLRLTQQLLHGNHDIVELANLVRQLGTRRTHKLRATAHRVCEQHVLAADLLVQRILLRPHPPELHLQIADVALGCAAGSDQHHARNRREQTPAPIRCL